VEWDKCWVGGGWLAIVSKLKVPWVASSSTQSQSLGFFFLLSTAYFGLPTLVLTQFAIVWNLLAQCSNRPWLMFLSPTITSISSKCRHNSTGMLAYVVSNFHCVQNKWTGAVWHPGWHVWPHTCAKLTTMLEIVPAAAAVSNEADQAYILTT